MCLVPGDYCEMVSNLLLTCSPWYGTICVNISYQERCFCAFFLTVALFWEVGQRAGCLSSLSYDTMLWLWAAAHCVAAFFVVEELAILRSRLPIVIFLLGLLLVAPAPASAQVTCTDYRAIDGNSDNYFTITNIGTPFVTDANYVAGDYFGTSFTLLTGDGSGLSLVGKYYNLSGVEVNLGVVLNNIGDVYTVTVHTQALTIYRFGGAFNYSYCFPTPPTATPTVTLTPTVTNTPVVTATPTVVLVTTTPVPPSFTPVASTEDLLTTIRDTQDTQVKFFVFSAVVLIGVLVLSFVRI